MGLIASLEKNFHLTCSSVAIIKYTEKSFLKRQRPMWRNCEGTDHHREKAEKAEAARAGSISLYCVSAQGEEAGVLVLSESLYF